VEIRVSVANATGANRLVRRLARLLDRSSVSFDDARNEVRVRSEELRAVFQVIGAVESWLAEDRGGSAEVSIGTRSFRRVGPRLLAAPSGRAA